MFLNIRKGSNKNFIIRHVMRHVMRHFLTGVILRKVGSANLVKGRSFHLELVIHQEKMTENY
jgi:hypothetical protein